MLLQKFQKMCKFANFLCYRALTSDANKSRLCMLSCCKFKKNYEFIQ